MEYPYWNPARYASATYEGNYAPPQRQNKWSRPVYASQQRRSYEDPVRQSAAYMEPSAYYQRAPAFSSGRSRGFGANTAPFHRPPRKGGLQRGGRPALSPPEEKIAGGLVRATRSISPLRVDSGAEKQVKDFMLQHYDAEQPTPVVEVLNVPKSTIKRGVLRFTVGAHQVLAIGQSTRAKVARALCLMHATELIDYYSLENPQGPPPLPLQEMDVSRRSGSHHEQNAPPRPDQFASWADYVHACEVRIGENEHRARDAQLIQYKVPCSWNPLVTRAAQMMKKVRTQLGSVQRLNEITRDATESLHVARITPRVFVGTLVLDAPSGLIATGVATTGKEARQRCAMHAMTILDLLERQSAERAAVGEINGVSTPSAHSAPFQSLLQSLNPHYSTLYTFFCHIFDDVRPTAHFTKEDQNYVCQLTISGVTCEGRGINRFEAERAAAEVALQEMELHDDRVQALNSFISRYPASTPEAMTSVSLPQQLSADIQRTIAHIRTIFPQTQPAASAGKEASLVEATSTTLSTEEKTIARMVTDQAAQRENPRYAAYLKDKLSSLRADPRYLENFHPRRSSLAMASVQAQVIKTVAQHPVTVVCGTTGCGKTTQVPQYLLDHEIMEGRGDQCNIIVTQPRRLSAFSVADRIAQERLGTVGGDVGYAVRLDAKPGRHINLCTTGVLLQVLSTQPDLEHVSHLIIDEVHERDINCDVTVALVKLLLKRNSRIKVVLMSATMQSGLFSSYFGNAPVINVEGAVYPTAVRFLDDIERIAANSSPSSIQNGLGIVNSPMFSVPSNRRFNHTVPKTDYSLIASIVLYSVSVDLQYVTQGKSILVFLPGWKELISAKQAIESTFSACSTLRHHIILLHSTVDSAKQRECFQPAPEGCVKIVLATNIAESGITIDDVAVVIDSGLIKQTSWASRAGRRYGGAGLSEDQHVSSFTTQLSLSFASKANATQRKGRAGRTQGGVCYRLFTASMYESLPNFPDAEIHRVPLTQLLLKLLALGYTAPKETLQTFMEPPSPANVDVSMQLLKNLGAVDTAGALTPLGMYLSKLPCDPRAGKMVMMGAVLNCLDSVLTVAATADACPYATNREVSLEVRKKRQLFSRGSQSDHISYLNAFNAFCANHESMDFARFNYLHLANLSVISKYKWQYRDILHHSGLISAAELYSVAQGGHTDSQTASRAAVEDTEDWSGSEGDRSSVHMLDGSGYGGSMCVDTSTLSKDALDVSLVKACVCSSFFPNVAMLNTAPRLSGKKITKITLRTKMHASIIPSKESVCRRLAAGPQGHGVPDTQEYLDSLLGSPKTVKSDTAGGAADSAAPAAFYVYQDIFSVREAHKDFLTNVSSISLWALLLFGAAEANVEYYEKLSICVVDKWIIIRIDPATFQMLHHLRNTLHECVWRKYQQPMNRANNEALSQLQQLCKAVLKAPQDINVPARKNIVDAGIIISPMALNEISNANNGALQNENYEYSDDVDEEDDEENGEQY